MEQWVNQSMWIISGTTLYQDEYPIPEEISTLPEHNETTNLLLYTHLVAK